MKKAESPYTLRTMVNKFSQWNLRIYMIFQTLMSTIKIHLAYH